MAKSVGRQAATCSATPSWRGWDVGIEPVWWVATTAFDHADRWAWTASARSAATRWPAPTLHQKLLDQGLVSNAFGAHESASCAIPTLARQTQREEMLAAALRRLLQAFASSSPTCPAPPD